MLTLNSNHITAIKNGQSPEHLQHVRGSLLVDRCFLYPSTWDTSESEYMINNVIVLFKVPARISVVSLQVMYAFDSNHVSIESPTSFYNRLGDANRLFRIIKATGNDIDINGFGFFIELDDDHTSNLYRFYTQPLYKLSPTNDLGEEDKVWICTEISDDTTRYFSDIQEVCYTLIYADTRESTSILL